MTSRSAAAACHPADHAPRIRQRSTAAHRQRGSWCRVPDSDDYGAAFPTSGCRGRLLGARPDLWVNHYLPHWTTPDRSAARYDHTAEGLRLRIEADQLDWRAEDAPMRVSNLQTGTFSGELGSRRGTHRHREDGLPVRTMTPTRLLWAPSAGRIDVTSAQREIRDACWPPGWSAPSTGTGGERALGHATVGFTWQVCSHVLPGRNQQAVDTVASLILISPATSARPPRRLATMSRGRPSR